MFGTLKDVQFDVSSHLSEAGRERSQVSHDARRDEDIPGQVLVEFPQGERHFVPARLLSAQAANQLRSALEFLFAKIHLGGKHWRE